MNYLSVCSGIEAATVAWHSLGWKPVAFSEIEKFPSQVLKHHYPEVPNVGDMTKYKEWNLGQPINLLVGGTPCQSFSVAGLRKGLEDPRGNLALVYCGILDNFRPKWFVWENVPGVLSSNGGRDFGSFLGAMAELGYGFAYRVLDAQYFGVAQRRKRVFVVGCLGDWRSAAKVLFEPESLSRNSAPSREAWQVSPTLTKECTGVSRTGHNEDGWYFPIVDGKTTIPKPINQTIEEKTSMAIAFTTEQTPKYNHEQALTLTKQSPTGGGQPQCVAQPITFSSVLSNQPVNDKSEVCQTLEAKNPMAVMQPIPINSMNAMRSPDAAASTGCGIGQEGEAMFTLTKGNHHAVAQPIGTDLYNGNITGDVACTMGTPGSSINASGPTVMVAQPFTETADCLTSAYGTKWNGNASATNGSLFANQGMAVRRLTPKECERLQGFPDNYTDIKPSNKDTPDGPRYKALGNSMAVPVMAWIGKRIQEVENT